mmetsp:Transcript_22025/g.46455  ORF Transcript_22025/g.46455 Transcript_22025/m.46455 type:complete len:405 (-) Transcript_22025:136-1350(-)|eukprot:CAMPEP_0183730528 /NCGR_PEP_ID=MMETSP0737-20130205/33071_1 /TAXON_ID=385413 /ORGANISM="Thalassiosira miniscula, Strain CCMP1093" /LENGTH=404 /DNA_ID=CAMNT_0025963051 /DNA_START=297 /DNA_END=1511 /DNA_ORIENTATION=-
MQSLILLVLGLFLMGNPPVGNFASAASPIRDIPEKVLIGYAGDYYENARKAVVEDGVNIVIWSFVNIVAANDNQEILPDGALFSTQRRAFSNVPDNAYDPQQRLKTTAVVKTGLDMGKIKDLIEELDGGGYSHVLHLASFGGWDGPHLDPSLSAQEWYNGWTNSIASDVFHGIDWDIEGSDDRMSPNNEFTIDCLEKMGDISRLMHNDGYVVTMAPPQSYLNVNDSNFSRYVNLTFSNRRWHNNFGNFGSNVYAYILAKYGDYIDLVSIQFYESYSDAAMAVYHDGVAADDYIFSYVYDIVVQKQSKFYVDFSQDAALNMESQYVEMPLSKLVIGLSNGWALTPSNLNKVLYISPEECKEAYLRLKNSDQGDLTPRGFMFWTINDRGSQDVYLARGINEFLHNL